MERKEGIEKLRKEEKRKNKTDRKTNFGIKFSFIMTDFEDTNSLSVMGINT